MKLNHDIKYGDWIIYNDDSFRSIYVYCHDGYDGAPDAHDDRHGTAWTLEQAIEAINDYEYEHSPEAA
jgi:hypothetical protein